MARVAIKGSIDSPVNGSAIVGVEVTVTKHVPGGTLGSGEAAKIYLSETEGTLLGSNTFVTDSKGTFTQGKEKSWASYWLEAGTYDFYYHATGINSFYEVKDLLSAENGSVGTPLLGAGSVTKEKIGEAAVGSSNVAEGAIEAKHLAAHAALPAGIGPLPWAGATVPAGWLLCDGKEVARTTYSALFEAVGTAYGSGDGLTTFNLPDLRGRVPVGADNMGTGAAGRVPSKAARGEAGGEQTHTLSETEMPSHSHAVTDPGHFHRAEQGDYFICGPEKAGLSSASLSLSGSQYALSNETETRTTGISIQAKGAGSAHNNMQPYQACLYIIKA